MLIGVNVTNLGSSPFLPMSVFVTTIELLLAKENRTAFKGIAKNGKLGNELGVRSAQGIRQARRIQCFNESPQYSDQVNFLGTMHRV